MIIVRSGGCCCLFVMMGIGVSMGLIPLSVVWCIRTLRHRL
jgi:hypothetical protein